MRPTWSEWRPGDQLVYVSDTRAAERDFGWTPRIGIEEGLGQLWSWVRDHRHLFVGVRAVNGTAAKVETVRSDASSILAGERA